MTEEMLAAAEKLNITPEMQEAARCHQRIIENAKLAGATLLEMGRALKEMRDKKLYTQLGFETFGAYVEGNGDYSFKERQAYTYIKATESFSEKFLTDHADLGVTKIGLLTALSEGDAVEVIEANNDLAGMTVDEIKELVREKQGLGEQLSFWKMETQKAKDNKAELLARIDKLTEELERAEANAEKNEEAKRKNALDAQKAEEKLKKEKDKHKEETDKLRAEIEMIKQQRDTVPEITDEQRQEIRAAAIAEAEEKHRKELAELEGQKKALEAKMQSGAPDEQRAAMKVYFDTLQNAARTFLAKIEELSEAEDRQKYRKGMTMFLESMCREMKADMEFGEEQSVENEKKTAQG